MIITLMGNDGSGKTTIAKDLVRIFKDLGYEVIYKHEYNYTILRFLFRIIGMEKIETERKKMLNENRKSLQYYLWPFLVWLDVCLSYFYFNFIKRKSIVILDRYLFDHFMSFKKLGYLMSPSEWLFMHSPKPDAILLLWVEPQIAYLRKQRAHTYKIDFYIQQTKEYLNLSKSQGIKAINTNKSIRETINEIIEALPVPMRTSIWKRGLQNKVLFSVAKKYGITLPNKVTTHFLNRRRKLDKTFAFIKDFFQNGALEYRIVKTLYQPEWIGNDVDILVSPKEFSKIVATFKELNMHRLILNQKSMDEGKVDIKLLNGLTIDLHSYIGWRNVVFIPFKGIFDKDYLIKESGLSFAKEKINSIIIILTHIFEKGFITLDDYKFLKTHFDESFMQTNFTYLYIILSDYVSWIKKTLTEKQNRSFPLFIPMPVIIRCYSKLFLYSKSAHSNVFWKLKAFIRDISIMIFWRMRYLIKTKLPFEVTFNDP